MDAVEKARKAQRQKAKKMNNDDENVIYTSFFENDTHILEQVASHASLASHQTDTNVFVQYDKRTGEIDKIFKYVDEEKTIKPAMEDLVRDKASYLPSGVENYGETQDLVKEIKEYFNKYFEAPKEFEKLLPYYTLFTWVYDKFPSIPYLHFMGLTGTGKTTAAEVVTSICYKGIDAAGSITIASIFRLADQWRGTLFMDEFDLNNFGQESYKAALSFLKAGVSDKSLFRVEGEKKRSVTAYKVKSPKIFTSETPISDAGLQSRTIVIKMNRNKRVLPLYRLDDYHTQGEHLRNKLLKWRLDHLDKINLKDIEHGFTELSKVDRRVQQIVTPIYYLSDEKTRKGIFEFVKEQEAETKRQRRESYDGAIFGHIFDYYEKEHSQPPLKYVTEQLNEEREAIGYKTKTSEKKVGEIVRKVLGFEIKRQTHEYISIIQVE
ncbi:MAG: hypothetical protein KDH96_11040, partial [Candidatus Riesia sp.]|nr:hypothetical protein [Candidatus Riesia sp.]